MNSMTGFGRAEITRKQFKIQVELASVNGRYLETIFRMPRILAAVESRIKDMIGKKFSRGKITVTVNLEESATALAENIINHEAARVYYAHLVKLKKQLKLPGDIEMSHIVAHPQFLANPADALDESQIWPDLQRIIVRASADLARMRAAEGLNLKKDMTSRLKKVGRLVASIEKLSPKNVAAYKQRLEKRLKELDSGIELEARRLAEEVTVFAERSDVTEECIRLRSHVDMFLATIKADGDSGKRLNFILQEMGRESNTIGSKSLSCETSAKAIELKEEIEKLREQVQNIE